MKLPPASPMASSPHAGGGGGAGHPSPAQIVGFLPAFVERGLRERVRYRYVHPRVLLQDDGSLCVEAPCCSRKVDPQGGVIPIARLAPEADGRWTLFHRDHRAAQWVLHEEGLSLVEALDALCLDARREFWQ